MDGLVGGYDQLVERQCYLQLLLQERDQVEGGREGGGAEEREGLRGRAEEREGELRSLIGREDSGREEGHGETV